MTYAEQIRHPSGALNPQEEVEQPMVWLTLAVVAGIVALVIIYIFRPQWLAKFGIALSDGAGAIGNPMGWV